MDGPAQIGGFCGKWPALTGPESLTFTVNKPLRIGRDVGFIGEFGDLAVNGRLKQRLKRR
jgi:hypothetical protein